jgi:hypothetical protein
MMTTHAVIPDVQAKAGTDFSFLERVGKYLAEKKPDVIVQIGDFADMPSLSSYDKGKKSFEGRSYTKDIEAATDAMAALVGPIMQEQWRLKRNKEKQWKPRLVLTLGNHEERINRAIEYDRMLEGLVSTDDLPYFDWEVYPFLEPVEIDGVFYCHYFPTGVLGRPAVTASAMVSKLHASCVAGHQQGKQVAYGKKPDGSMITCIIAGSAYEHEEAYLNFQGNKHWRGIIMLHEVNNGTFDEMFVSLDYLRKKYG